MLDIVITLLGAEIFKKIFKKKRNKNDPKYKNEKKK